MSSNRSARKRKFRNMRKVARKNFLDKITSPFDRCYWCGTAVLWRERVPEDWTLTFYGHQRGRIVRDGKVEYYALATVDHVEGLGDGGGNHLFNLVASCPPCNTIRD